MSIRSARPWPSSTRVRRAGPAVAVAGLLIAASVVATSNGRSEPTEMPTGPTVAEMREYPDHPDLPVTYHEALDAGTVEQYDWGDHCDTERRYNDTDTTLARVAIPSTYSPPCVPSWDGDRPWVSRGGNTFGTNGGSTAPGVTADIIKVVFYLPAEQDVAKQLEQFGVVDSGDVALEQIRTLVDMNNRLYETYGRSVEVVPFRATGDGRSPSAGKADAVKVAEMGVFASIGGPTQTTAYQRELARHGVLCFSCGYAATDDVMATDAPYAWGYLATPDQLLFGTFGFGSSLLYGAKAENAGSAELRAMTRRFGIVHYEQDPPVYGPLRKEAIDTFGARGQSAELIVQYVLDPNTLNAQAQAIIGRLKRENITSVVFLGDPLMPRLLTQQASRQDYHPEWIFTGTASTDTTAVARLYDPEQMRHAFGASSGSARQEPELTESWQMYRWWYGSDPDAPRTLLGWGPVVQQLFLGIHMAGPNLRAETFAGGLFNYPPTGGTDIVGVSPVNLFLDGYLEGDTTPAISFGFHTDPDRPDFVAIDDFSITWWDQDARGPDENGVIGRGMWQYTGKGLRIELGRPAVPEGVTGDFLFAKTLFEAGGPLADNVKAIGFDDIEIASTVLDQTPKLDVLPTYEPRPGSPAARGG